jgi:WD40 repeat protein
MVRKDRTFIDAIKTYYQSDIEDNEKHDTEVENVIYIDKLKHLLVMERDAKKFKVYNSKTGRLLESVPSARNVKGGAIISAAYVEMDKAKYVATCQNNNCINFWDANNYGHRERLNTTDIQLCLEWCGQGVNRLFTGGLDRKIHCYDIEKLEEEQRPPAREKNESGDMPFDLDDPIHYNKHDKLEELRFHTHPITALLPIPEMNLIASASADAKMILWSMRDLAFKSAHTDHQGAIHCLEWYADQQLILSAGFDHDVYIWNPIVRDRIF